MIVLDDLLFESAPLNLPIPRLYAAVKLLVH